jgi:hypothetical protein
MSTGNRIPWREANAIAEDLVNQLRPHCSQIDIAGSIRRGRSTIGDIEIVCFPLPYESTPLFRSGIALVVEQYEKVKGELPCRYTQRIHAAQQWGQRCESHGCEYTLEETPETVTVCLVDDIGNQRKFRVRAQTSRDYFADELP